MRRGDEPASEMDRRALTGTPITTDRLPVRSADTSPSDPLFDEFWAVYPRKVGKGAAKRGWRMALRGTTAEEIIAAAGRFRDECLARGTEQQYIPHPGSWLGKERYSDETPTPAEVSVVPVPLPAGRLNDEQLLAAVIRLACDQEHPVTAAAEIVRAVRGQMAPVDLEGFPVVSAERGQKLAEMPYPEYLLTPEWQARRKVILKRAGCRCQVCNRDRTMNVHHRTYERRGVEIPADLIALCDECHALYHGKGLLAEEPAA